MNREIGKVRSERCTQPCEGADFIQAGGELGALIRAKDWSQTAVGAPERWPQSLRTAVSLCLASNFPINIIWGADHTQIYNDGYRDVCGEVHPRALGENYRVTWESAWPAIGEPFEKALAGDTSYLENQRMFLMRNGYLEETFFTFSHSPIRDESGGIGGLFHPVTETSPTMLAERRTRALRDLGAELGRFEDAVAVGTATVATLTRFEYDLPFVLYYMREDVADCYRLIAGHGMDAGTVGAPYAIPAGADEPWPLSGALSGARIVEVGDLRDAIRGTRCGPYPEPAQRALVIPVAAAGGSAVLVAGVSPRLQLDEAYRAFYELLGATITNALTSVRTREDQRRRAEALAEIDRAKTAFFSNVSHEFRTPLTLMLGPLEEILRDPLVVHVRPQLCTVHRNGLRLLRLVNALLDFSRVEAGRADAHFEAIDLCALTVQVVSNFQSACDVAGIRLVVDCPQLPEPVYVDPEMWETIVLNLVSNAFKFTAEGSITVAIRRIDRDAVLTVRDTGEGIPAKELARIFERFHRVESTHGRTHEGSGIGLALVKELVGLHRGSADVHSTLGEGTTFAVRVPLGEAHLPAERITTGGPPREASRRGYAFAQEALQWVPGTNVPPADRPPEPSGASSSDTFEQARILLVDDSPDMRDYIRRLLADRYDVMTATDGIHALSVMEKHPPDLVVSDVMMPKLDGFGLVKAIRQRPDFANVRIVLLSARAGEESRVEGLDVGADDYLVKPFTSQELLARVATNVHVARLRRRADDALRSSERERRIAAAFQSASLPTSLPDIPGISLSCLYRPASQDANVGGDFYDAFRLLDGRIVISIGDVAGAGLEAAATMAAVRQSIRAVACVNPNPQMLLRAADDVFSEARGPAFASAFVAVIDPLTFSIRYANAGHPPPLLRLPDGRVEALGGKDLLLGVTPEIEDGLREVGQLLAPPGALIVLYTDGITENTRDALAGERRVIDAVSGLTDAERASDELAHIICERTLGPGNSSHDDIAVLAVRLRERLTACEQPRVRRWTFSAADGEAAHRVRCELSDELCSLRLKPNEVFAAEMVFSELIGNVVRHAGTDVEVLVDNSRTSPVLHVLDCGAGFSLNTKLPADQFEEGGRGLFIVSQLVRDFTVAPRTAAVGSHARAVLLGHLAPSRKTADNSRRHAELPA